MAKAYNLPFDYVLHEMSFANMTLYSAVIPEYRSKRGKGDDGKKIRMDDPKSRDMAIAALKRMK